MAIRVYSIADTQTKRHRFEWLDRSISDNGTGEIYFRVFNRQTDSKLLSSARFEEIFYGKRKYAT
jgi:hypothetical protein